MNPTHSKFVLDSYASIQETRDRSLTLSFSSRFSPKLAGFKQRKVNNWARMKRRFDYRMKRIQTKHENKWKNSSNENQLFSTKRKKKMENTTEAIERRSEKKKLTLNTYSPLTNGLLKLYAFREENQINEREKMK